MPGFDDRIVQRRSGPAHRLLDPDPLAGGAEPVRGVLAALIGVQNDPGDRFAAAADRDRHGQSTVGAFGVVVLRHREPTTIRRDRISSTLSKYSLPSSVVTSVPSPYHFWLIVVAASRGR